MAAPKGNKNAFGNRGGGRKSAYQEKCRAELLEEAFFGEIDVKEFTKKLSGKKSLWNLWLLKGLQGNERVLKEMFNKLFPDKLEYAADPRSKQMESLENALKAFAGHPNK